MQEEMNLIQFQKLALEKRLELLEDEDQDLMNMRNSSKNKRRSNDRVQHKYSDEY